jgi:hypothetical protein
MGSVEGKRNDTGMRFVLQQAVEGNQEGPLWGEDHFPALIDWKDVVVTSGLRQRIKNARLVRRQASSLVARGADGEGNRYFVQVIVEGTPYQKAKKAHGTGTMELDIGHSTLAMVLSEGEAHLVEFCQELRPAIDKKRRLQRKMQRQRRATNPHNPLRQGQARSVGAGARTPASLEEGDSEYSMMTAHHCCLSLHRFL